MVAQWWCSGGAVMVQSMCVCHLLSHCCLHASRQVCQKVISTRHVSRESEGGTRGIMRSAVQRVTMRQRVLRIPETVQPSPRAANTEHAANTAAPVEAPRTFGGFSGGLSAPQPRADTSTASEPPDAASKATSTPTPPATADVNTTKEQGGGDGGAARKEGETSFRSRVQVANDPAVDVPVASGKRGGGCIIL